MASVRLFYGIVRRIAVRLGAVFGTFRIFPNGIGHELISCLIT